MYDIGCIGLLVQIMLEVMAVAIVAAGSRINLLKGMTEACVLMLQEVVRRNLHCKRINNLHISRSRVAPSTINGAGQGLFATRDIEAGELITCYPGDAVLCWEDSDHSWARDIRVFHGSHVSRCIRFFL